MSCLLWFITIFTRAWNYSLNAWLSNSFFNRQLFDLGNRFVKKLRPKMYSFKFTSSVTFFKNMSGTYRSRNWWINIISFIFPTRHLIKTKLQAGSKHYLNVSQLSTIQNLTILGYKIQQAVVWSFSQLMYMVL
jgi:hypothetical protein